ncbi:MAG: hypothetical protein IKL10_10520 [Clostridia bacterium]|nr:hypothetical protein [Clostridia bacterium]
MNKKKRIMKILAALTAFVLIGVVLFFVNAFLGNPVSYLLARHSASQYIEENYPEADFDIDGISYFFEDAKYSVSIKSPSSIDSHFTIKTDFAGRIKYNSYESDILKKGNTIERINRDYYDMVSAVFSSPVFPYETSHAFAKVYISYDEILNSEQNGVILTEELELDKIYDMKEVGEKAGTVILSVRDEVSVEKAAEILEKTKLLLNSAEVYFNRIDFILEEKHSPDIKVEKRINLDGFPAAFIGSEDLKERIELYK